MALDDILATIRSDAEAVIREVEAATASQVGEITDRADAEAIRVEQEVAGSRDRAAAREAARFVDRARLDARRASLAAVETAYQETLAEVRARLSSMRETEAYPTVLVRLLDEGLAVLPDATRVEVDPVDVDLVRSVLASRDRAGIEVAPASPGAGGMDLTTGDGRLVRNTFESRLARADRLLRRLVATHLPAGWST